MDSHLVCLYRVLLVSHTVSQNRYLSSETSDAQVSKPANSRRIGRWHPCEAGHGHFLFHTLGMRECLSRRTNRVSMRRPLTRYTVESAQTSPRRVIAPCGEEQLPWLRAKIYLMASGCRPLYRNAAKDLLSSRLWQLRKPSQGRLCPPRQQMG